jgi:hypothetical protein
MALPYETQSNKFQSAYTLIRCAHYFGHFQNAYPTMNDKEAPIFGLEWMKAVDVIEGYTSIYKIIKPLGACESITTFQSVEVCRTTIQQAIPGPV